MKFGQLGFYAQDEIKVNPKAKVTLGLRADRPVYIEEHWKTRYAALTFPDKNGTMTRILVSGLHQDSTCLPDVAGIRWDVKGDKSLIIRVIARYLQWS